jgi:arabinose-5-phosphate isomerase
LKKQNKRREALRSIRRVISLEAAALREVGAAVDGSYVDAVELLARCRGKVIVTGVGKSGLIGQKIAATLASTGTPAIYLHPAEGMHGDLGSVERRDLIVAIGKSGESHELNALLPAIKRIGAKIIAITANPRSTLAKGAAVVLNTPIRLEACPLNLAPTASTTAALAVGDARAVALREGRRFRTEHFALHHPGGQLGRRLTLQVRDVMRKGSENPVIRLESTVARMLAELTRKHAGAVSIVNGKGRLVGLITDYDIRRMLEKGKRLTEVSIIEIMNKKPSSIREDRLAVEAVELMSDRSSPFNVLPVVDARGRSVGLIQIHDLRAVGL